MKKALAIILGTIMAVALSGLSAAPAHAAPPTVTTTKACFSVIWGPCGQVTFSESAGAALANSYLGTPAQVFAHGLCLAVPTVPGKAYCEAIVAYHAGEIRGELKSAVRSGSDLRCLSVRFYVIALSQQLGRAGSVTDCSIAGLTPGGGGGSWKPMSYNPERQTHVPDGGSNGGGGGSW
jgi:hypothetical protein